MARACLPASATGRDYRGSGAGALTVEDDRAAGGLKLEQLAGLSLNLPARLEPTRPIDPSETSHPHLAHLPFSQVSCLKL